MLQNCFEYKSGAHSIENLLLNNKSFNTKQENHKRQTILSMQLLLLKARTDIIYAKTF